jgi:hypothetical protein
MIGRPWESIDWVVHGVRSENHHSGNRQGVLYIFRVRVLTPGVRCLPEFYSVYDGISKRSSTSACGLRAITLSNWLLGNGITEILDIDTLL